MIELIFVIVIIGILATVALPRLSSTRDDAKGGMCATELAGIVSEVITQYTKLGYTDFQTLSVRQLTNAKFGILGTTVNDTEVEQGGSQPVVGGLTYKCEGEATATLAFVYSTQNAKEYNLSVTPLSTTTSPVSIAATTLIAKNFKTTVGVAGQVPLAY